MSFVPKTGDTESIGMAHGASSGINAGEVVVFDRSNKIVIVGTAALLAEDNAGVAMEDAETTAGVVQVVPFRQGQLWEYDCTNNTAANQLCIRHLLTDAATVANTSSDITTNVTTFTAIRNQGAASDKKQVGFVTYVPPTLS